MEEKHIYDLLTAVQSGTINLDEAMKKIKHLPFEDVGYAMIDRHRALRQGHPEVIYCEGKTPEQIAGIARRMSMDHNNILATRISPEAVEALKAVTEHVDYNSDARLAVINRKIESVTETSILVVTGGTSDIPVAEEAAITAEVLGNKVERLFDVGVAGLHRLLSHLSILDEASVIIAVAGMEGALASVVGGLVDKPVIGVPTSVGYGTGTGGFAALLSMLNSCSSGVGVMNIDNGFGAGYLASLINRQITKALNKK